MTKEKVSVYFRKSSGTSEREIEFPHSCPHCGMTMKPTFYHAISDNSYSDSFQTIGVLFSCSVPDCKKFFSGQYRNLRADVYREPSVVVLPYTSLVGYHLPENLNVVSPKFIEIYEEAFEIEKLQKFNAAGMVYRKALEFLVKDFAILRNPDPVDVENIQKDMLGKVITDYFSDFPRIQTLAKASAWIGNDETHYTRRHEDYDIEDLKNFVNAVALFISADEMVDQASELLKS